MLNIKSFIKDICEELIKEEHLYGDGFNVDSPVKEEGDRCEGLTFVITGKVSVFKNRDAFTEYVEAQGGKVSGSVSKKTSYLVNNDASSTSSKNQKARELGIPIISEEEFIEKYGCE